MRNSDYVTRARRRATEWKSTTTTLPEAARGPAAYFRAGAPQGMYPFWLPVGYAAGADSYRAAVARLSADDLSAHYTTGLTWFRGEFVPYLKDVLARLSGGAWDLGDFEALRGQLTPEALAATVASQSAEEERTGEPTLPENGSEETKQRGWFRR